LREPVATGAGRPTFGRVVEIEVTHREGDLWRVGIREGSGATEHEVRVTERDRKRLAPDAPVERLLEASFRFLLEREPKESILPRFDLPVITRYFPEYPDEIRGRLET
jgi:hypothetical protein